MALCAAGFTIRLGCSLGGIIGALKQMRKIFDESGFALKVYKAAPGSDNEASKWMACRLKTMRQQRYVDFNWDKSLIWCPIHYLFNFLLQVFGSVGLIAGLKACLRVMEYFSPDLVVFSEFLNVIIDLVTQLVAEEAEEGIKEISIKLTKAAGAGVVGINLLSLLFCSLEVRRAFMVKNGLAEDVEKAITEFQDYFCKTAATQTEESSGE